MLSGGRVNPGFERANPGESCRKANFATQTDPIGSQSDLNPIHGQRATRITL